MTESTDLYAFYIVKNNDEFGESSRGPYTMADAESLVQADEKIITRKSLATLQQQSILLDGEDMERSQSSLLDNEQMLREINRWGIFLIVMGIIQITTSGYLSNTWGILLIVIGLASFYFQSSAMFAVYGAALSWAAISNALSGSGGWIAFSVLQVFFAFQTFRKFFHFRPVSPSSQYPEVEDNQYEHLKNDKAAKLFPWLSLLIGLSSVVVLVVALLGVVIFFIVAGDSDTPSFFVFAEGIMIDLAVIGFATGLASIFSRYKYKPLSIIGMVASILVLLIEIIGNLIL